MRTMMGIPVAVILFASVVMFGVALSTLGSPQPAFLVTSGGAAAQLQIETRKLKNVEDDLMGLSGIEAMRKSKEAQALQTRISQLRVMAARDGPARVQALSSKPSKVATRRGKMWNAPLATVHAVEVIGSDDVAEPLDDTRAGLSVAHEEAAILARNLAKARKQAVLPSLHVAVPPLVPSNAKILRLLPGQALPHGAHVLSPEQVSSLTSAKGTPASGAEALVGSTGFTASQLKVYADSMRVKAQMELHKAERKKNASLDQAAKGQHMMMQGWADLQSADHLSGTATSLGSVAQELTMDAKEQMGHADKWISKASTLKLSNGDLVDTAAST